MGGENIKIVNLTLNRLPSGASVSAPDTEIDWYDFGGGWLVAPALPEVEGENMAALCCIRNRKVWYKIYSGNFSVEDLPKMKEELLPQFITELEDVINGRTANS